MSRRVKIEEILVWTFLVKMASKKNALTMGEKRLTGCLLWRSRRRRLPFVDGNYQRQTLIWTTLRRVNAEEKGERRRKESEVCRHLQLSRWRTPSHKTRTSGLQTAPILTFPKLRTLCGKNVIDIWTHHHCIDIVGVIFRRTRQGQCDPISLYWHWGHNTCSLGDPRIKQYRRGYFKELINVCL